MAEYDLLVRGGEVLDPASGRRETADVAVRAGRIAAIGAALRARAGRTIDVRGRMVTPGLIDLHTHLGFEIHRQVLAPETACPPGGVTTAVDMGSTGAWTFPWYRQRVLEGCPIRLYSFVNISALGTTAIHTPYYVEHYGAYIDVPEVIRTIEAHRDYIRGVKVFAAGQMVGHWALGAIAAAQEAAAQPGCPSPCTSHRGRRAWTRASSAGGPAISSRTPQPRTTRASWTRTARCAPRCGARANAACGST
jgi:dihydroorotase